MANSLPDLKRFTTRPAGLGRAYVHKNRLAVVPSGSRNLGVDVKRMAATFVVTTDDPDRVDDVVVSAGIDLTNFKANPIGFYGHQIYPFPIGKWEDPKGKLCVWPEDGKTTATIYFFQDKEGQSTEVGRVAYQVFALIEAGILRATTIGFNPIGDAIPRGQGYRFERVDLLEISVVGIPAQPTATLVRECLSRGKLAGGAILPTIRKSLEALAEPSPVWSNGATLPLEEPMSKKWGKTVSKKKPMAKDSVQDCVSAKIPKLRDEGFPEDQAIAIAENMCRNGKSLEEAKAALEGSSGTTGGYAVPEDDDDMKALCGRLEVLTDRVEKAVASVQKKPPPDQQPPDPNGDGAGPNGEDGPPEPGTGKADPKDVLNRLVDALTDYIDLTTKPAPTQAPPDMQDEEDDDEEDEEGDMDLDGSQEDDDEKQGMDRYNFRAAGPAQIKGRYHKAAVIRKAVQVCTDAAAHLKDCGGMAVDTKWTSTHKSAALHHHSELMGLVKAFGEPDDEEPEAEPGASDNHPPAVVTKKELPAEVDEGLDEACILAALRPVRDRVTAVGNTWDSLQGTMP